VLTTYVGALNKELEAQRQAWSGLDSKAGVLLSASAVVVTIATALPGEPRWATFWVALAGAVSAGLSAWSIYPRHLQGSPNRELLRLGLEEKETEQEHQAVLASLLEAVLEENDPLLSRKLRWVRLATGALAASVLLAALGTL
jgi:hypothetical protein